MTNPYSLENNLLGLGEIARLLAENELTDELQSYWREKYVEILKADLFKVSDEVMVAFSQVDFDSPLTPSGKLFLCNHLDDDGVLDETALQNTIETAIRMLDSLIEKIPFNEKNKELVKKNRKLNLELGDFDEYSKINTVDAVNYVGNLVSNFAYRASESLAEEKGQCGNWGSHSKSLKPKSFEYWYNIYNGEIKNSLDIITSVASGDIKISDYEIIPRRNSHLLGFSNLDAWKVWSDREVQSVSLSKESLNHSTIASNLALETLEESQNAVFEKIGQDASQIEMATPVLTLIDSVFMYQIGELVKVVDTQDPNFGKIYQVAELINPTQYKLIGDSEIESQIWHEDSLKPVDLGEILNKVNDSKEESLKSKVELLGLKTEKLELEKSQLTTENLELIANIELLQNQITQLEAENKSLKEAQETINLATLELEIQKATLQLESQKHELLQEHKTSLLENETLEDNYYLAKANLEILGNDCGSDCGFDSVNVEKNVENIIKIDKNITQVIVQKPKRKASLLSMLSRS